MIKVYVDLIRRGFKTIADVPERWRAAVIAELEASEQWTP